MLDRVVAVALQAADEASSCRVVVATDDDRIADHAATFGVDVVMTAAALDSGTSRAYAAASQQPQKPAYVVNLQGDAPFTPPGMVVEMLRTLRNSPEKDSRAGGVVTPVFQLDWPRLDRLRAHKIAVPFSGTTCVRAADGQALWFSKAIVPAIRNEAELRKLPTSPVWQHVGLYGYAMAALEWFASAPCSPYELLEGLEQLRFLENGWRIKTIAVEAPDHLLAGIDTPEDLAKAEEAIRRLEDVEPA